MVNIIDDDIWNTEPALKPEDEIILRKLHDMLQSTADDLKLLSGELSKFHEPGVQVKTTPTPLDEDFNEKVHIEEIVNAKFHGLKMIDKSPICVPENKLRKDVKDDIKPTNNIQKPKITNSNIPVNSLPVYKKPIINRNLGITRTRVIQINGNENSAKTEKLNNGKVVNAPAVAYNEYSYKYIEPKYKTPCKKFQVQEMPSINIRSELKEQKVLQLDIIPETKEPETPNTITKNVSVVTVQHEIIKSKSLIATKILPSESHEPIQNHKISYPKTVRKISKMSTCDSSGSTNNISSDTQIKLKTQKRILSSIRSSPKSSTRSDRKKVNNKRESEKRSNVNLDEWRKKLNSVYGPSNSNKKSPKSKNKAKVSPKKSNLSQNTSTHLNNLNNIDYIPYSKLTIGGARASDIEREISDIPNKKDLPLSPILDRILSSRENSFSKNSPRKQKPKDTLKVLTTSDENLLQEVIDIERTVSETLSKNLKNINNEPKVPEISSDSDEVKENDSYADDFEDEKSDHSGMSGNQKTNSTHSNDGKKSSDEKNTYSSNGDNGDNNDHNKNEEPVPSASNSNIHNLTYTKRSNLSFKNKVDIFEFVHSVDTHDSATQSNTGHKISPKETQTSPTNDKHLQPIHNDLWPSIDPKGEVEKMFQIEKEFIKKLIVEEYGDILEKNIDKPSTSKGIEPTRNVSASQKNTQTSPAHVKNVMTSPTRTKTRTTSPFPRLSIDHHTSPLIFVTNEDDVKIETENEDDPGISINLSSPRFSLRLPRTSREVISNLGDSVPRSGKKTASEVKHVKKTNLSLTSTSTLEADSSEISMGEVKLRKHLGKITFFSDSESVSSSSSKCSSDFQSGILPLRSEGELSLGRNKKSNKRNKSEGEASFGCL